MVAFTLFPIILIAVLVGLIGVFFFASSETRRSMGKVLAGMMFFAGVAVLAYVALRVFGVPLGRASGAFVPSVPNQSGMTMFGPIVILFFMVLIPVAFLLAFVFAKKEPKSPMVPAVVKEPSGSLVSKMFVGVALMGGVIAFVLAAIFSIALLRVNVSEKAATVVVSDQHEVRTLDGTTDVEVMRLEDHLLALNEPLVVLDDEAEEPEATATELEEESTPDGKKADEKPANVAKSPSGDDPPAWVGRDAFRDGAVYMAPVTLDPGPSQELCEEELLLPAVTEKIKAYAGEKLGREAARHVRLPFEYIRNEMIGNDLWVEAVKVESFSELDQKLGREIWGDAANASTDDWVRLHALVKFDADVDSRIEQQWIGAIRQERLQGVAVLTVVVLLALASLYAYMRFDLATAGAYRNRLRFAALTAIMAVILGVFLTR